MVKLLLTFVNFCVILYKNNKGDVFMKTKLQLLLTLLSLTLLLTSCGSSYSDDDSWKSKKWNDLSGSEKGKAYNYIDNLLDSADID